MNGLIYAQYDYLDSICDNWSGLVLGNFEAIMPLPWRKKYGFRYYYIPPFIQQLGLIGNTVLDADVLDALISKIRGFAWYGDLHFNFSNHLLASELHCKNRTNFIIDLSGSYAHIQKQYSTDLKQILQKTEPGLLVYETHYNSADAISHYQQQYAERMPHLSAKTFTALKNLCSFFTERGNCICRAATTKEGKVLSDTLLLKDGKRIYHLLNTTFPEGRALHSNHWLTDQVLKEFSNTGLLFDFEGSDLPGVKTFYKKFGGHIQPYFHYRRNLWQ